MTFRLTFLVPALLSFAVISGASAQSSVSGVNDGVAEYRAGNAAAAWTLLEPAAAEGDTKAKRYLAYIILDGDAPADARVDFFDGTALLKEAAMAGDYAALVRLEDLRRQQLAHSPSLGDMIAVETARADAGDPVAAWRLADRFETGDGVAPSPADEAKWLEVAAEAEAARFPKAPEAAYRLCMLNALSEEARDADAARHWCARAAENGHTGAALVLKRLAMLQD
ncbi:hypothetical protein [Hyphococcus sp.]|jgi:TPR repeat protein|uniref:hypothetical protein n=1 Tax=Hyphococcus sp. TaxID=2038636 RepID=UPI003D0B7024